MVVAKHVTGCSILVWFNNFDRTTNFYCSHTLLFKLPVHMRFRAAIWETGVKDILMVASIVLSLQYASSHELFFWS